VTLSGRYNRNTVQNADRIQPQGGPGSLNGNNVYGRLNPAIGVTWGPKPAWNAYMSYTQGSRAPTSVELGCADPDNPCSLPNALAGDPPLKQVSTGTWEAGLRGKPGSGISWSASGFRSENRNDILFVASQVSGSGYFRNFGKTLRQGAEVSLQVRLKRITSGAGYTFLDATYQTAETVSGTGNSTNDSAVLGLKGTHGVIHITPGNRIPLVPQHNFKIFGDVEVTRRFSVDLDLLAISDSYARGNENNLHQPDGKYYLGPGKSPGYAVVNLRGHYDLTRRFQLAAQIDNLFDHQYYTAAQLGATGFNDQGTFVARAFPAYANGEYPVQQATFYAPGAPRRAWVELRLRF
jgi:outer membrane receptor protein involved in Fe transport